MFEKRNNNLHPLDSSLEEIDTSSLQVRCLFMSVRYSCVCNCGTEIKEDFAEESSSLVIRHL